MKLIYEIFMFKAENKKINGSFVTAKDLVEVLTGKEDANFSIQNGKFNFFTCSNEILKCNEYKYNSSSILIAGNGDFNVKHYTGKFNAYNKILSVVVTVAFAIIYFFLPDKIPALHHGSELIYVPKLFGVILPPMFIILIQLILSLQNRLNKINNVLLACVAIGMLIYYLRWI
mgnify:CR=1 FL=1